MFIWRFPKLEDPHSGWLRRENPNQTWMINRAIPILGHHHLVWPFKHMLDPWGIDRIYHIRYISTPIPPYFPHGHGLPPVLPRLLTKQLPFQEIPAAKLPAAKAQGQLPQLPASASAVPAQCVELMAQCGLERHGNPGNLWGISWYLSLKLWNRSLRLISYIYIYIYIHTYIYIYICVCMYLVTYIYIYVFIHLFVFIYLYLYS